VLDLRLGLPDAPVDRRQVTVNRLHLVRQRGQGFLHFCQRSPRCIEVIPQAIQLFIECVVTLLCCAASALGYFALRGLQLHQPLVDDSEVAGHLQLRFLFVVRYPLAPVPSSLGAIEPQHTHLPLPHRVEVPLRLLKVAVQRLPDVGQHQTLLRLEVVSEWSHALEQGPQSGRFAVPRFDVHEAETMARTPPMKARAKR